MYADQAARPQVVSEYDLPQAQWTRFDAALRVASAVYEAPIAVVSLVADGSTQVRAAWGLSMSDTADMGSLCSQVPQGFSTFVVSDTHHDPRVSGHHSVRVAANIRFCAITPLITAGGHIIGSLSVMDRAPRTDVTPAQRGQLEDIASLVVQQLELMRDGHRAVIQGESAE